MAVCQKCNKEMQGAKSCNHEAIQHNGALYGRIPYGKEKFGGEESPTIVAYKHDCRDCGVKPGGYHHKYCCIESCPICGGQLLSCGHFQE